MLVNWNHCWSESSHCPLPPFGGGQCDRRIHRHISIWTFSELVWRWRSCIRLSKNAPSGQQKLRTDDPFWRCVYRRRVVLLHWQGLKCRTPCWVSAFLRKPVGAKELRRKPFPCFYRCYMKRSGSEQSARFRFTIVLLRREFLKKRLSTAWGVRRGRKAI